MTSPCRLVWPTGALLGEGPIWSAASGTISYVDIKGSAVHRYHPESGRHDTLDVEGQPSFIVPVEGGHRLVGSGDGLYLLDDAGLGERIMTIAMPAHNRTNDATVDCQGRLWFGTMDDAEQQATGAIYSLVEGRLSRAGGDAIVTNGPAVTSDGRTLFHVDSSSRTIWRHRLGEDATWEESTPFLRLSEAEGFPDGIVLDSEGCLWVALWDGWGVQRYAPDGKLLQRVDLPCARVTKIAFGGPDLRTAYVTTARVGLSEEELAAQPLAGGLFAFDAPVAGLPLPSVRLSA
ncbi:MAG TPA: SMP-30/gluconolactonase/LRE family protein [Sphingobium sp.]